MYLFEGPKGAVSRHVGVESRRDSVLVLGAKGIVKDLCSRTVPAIE